MPALQLLCLRPEPCQTRANALHCLPPLPVLLNGTHMSLIREKTWLKMLIQQNPYSLSAPTSSVFLSPSQTHTSRGILRSVLLCTHVRVKINWTTNASVEVVVQVLRSWIPSPHCRLFYEKQRHGIWGCRGGTSTSELNLSPQAMASFWCAGLMSCHCIVYSCKTWLSLLDGKTLLWLTTCIRHALVYCISEWEC